MPGNMTPPEQIYALLTMGLSGKIIDVANKKVSAHARQCLLCSHANGVVCEEAMRLGGEGATVLLRMLVDRYPQQGALLAAAHQLAACLNIRLVIEEIPETTGRPN